MPEILQSPDLDAYGLSKLREKSARLMETRRKPRAGVAEEVRDWSDHFRKAPTTQLLVRPKF